MFGAVNPEAPKPAGNTTLVFGAKPAAGNTTAMFGAVNPEAPKPAPVRNTTAMFGALGPEAAAKPPGSSTMVFGALGAGPAAPKPAPAGNTTAMFGALGPEAAARPAGSSTMVFGAVGAAPEPKPADAAKPAGSSTMMFGAVGAAPPAPKPAASPSSTMMFGAVGGAAPGAPEPKPAEPALQPKPAPSSTMTFGTPPAAGATPAWQAPPPVEANFSPQSDAPTEPPGPMAPPRRAVTGPVPAPFPGSHPAVSAEDEALARSLEGRGKRVGGIAAALVALALAAGGGYWYVHRPHPPPPELVAQVREASRGIELDTVAGLDASRKQLATLAAVSPPNYVAAQANELVAMSLQGADLRAQAMALQAEFAALEKQHTHADADHARADWRMLVNSLVDQMKDVKARLDPLQTRATALDQDENALFRQLSAARAQLDGPSPELERAFGVYYAFKGSDQAARFAQSYRALVPHDGWADLIAAAAADQPRQTPEVLKAGLAAAQAALKANPRLTRAKRLAAELSLALHDPAGAQAQATELSLLTPDDARVKLLLANIDAAEKAAHPAPEPAPENPAPAPQ
jgi:hypothetical protein